MAKALNHLGISGTFFATTQHLGKKLLWHDLLMLFEQHASVAEKEKFIRLLAEKVPSENFKNLTIEEKLKYLSLDNRLPLLDFIREKVNSLIQQPLMMTEEELVELEDQGHIVGAHTLNHPILSLESPQVARCEIEEDIKLLSSILNNKVQAFAYPNGKPNKDYENEHLKILQQLEIDYAVSTAPGYFEAGSDPLQIPRFGLRGRSHLGFTKCVVSNLSSPPEFVEYRGYETTN